MSEIATQHLYVLQNEYGLIKIGRSLDPSRRAANVAASDKCRADIVVVFPNAGQREEAVHLLLTEHALDGEWFNGTEQGRAAIEACLTDGAPIIWPHSFAAEKGAAWFSRLEALRDQRSFEKLYDRIFRQIDRNFDSPLANDSIFFCYALSETGRPPQQFWIRKGRKLIELKGFSGGRAEDAIPVPNYNTDLVAALELWPIWSRPPVWTSSIKDCVMAALRARQDIVREVGRQIAREVIDAG